MKGAFWVGGTLGAGYVGMAASAAPEGVLMVGMSEFTPESLVDVDKLGISLVAVSAEVDVDVEDSPSLADVWPMVGIASEAVAVSSAVVVASEVAAAAVVSSS